MSINTLLSNTTILDELVNLIDAKSGNVASVDASGTYISIAPTTGNVKVGLAVGLPSASGDVLSSNVEGVLSWVTQSSGSINAVDASGTFISTSTTAGVANVGLAVGLPSTSGDVLSSTATGVLSWAPQSGGVGLVASNSVNNPVGTPLSLPAEVFTSIVSIANVALTAGQYVNITGAVGPFSAGGAVECVLWASLGTSNTASSPTNALALSGVNMSWWFVVPTTGTYTLQLAGQPISTANSIVGFVGLSYAVFA